MIIIAGKAIKISAKTAAKLPYVERATASWPRPFFKRLCPGKIESSVSVSGQPKNMEGIKSIKVCVNAIATTNTARYNGFIEKNNVADKLIRKAPTRFICMPGIRPVIVPIKIPKARNKIISISIWIKTFNN